jgi:hypothetical protein
VYGPRSHLDSSLRPMSRFAGVPTPSLQVILIAELCL